MFFDLNAILWPCDFLVLRFGTFTDNCVNSITANKNWIEKSSRRCWEGLKFGVAVKNYDFRNMRFLEYSITHISAYANISNGNFISDSAKLFSGFTLCIEIRHLVKPWPYENFHKCSIFFYIWVRIYYFIIIMRNKILILLFASTCANFLDMVIPKTCPWVFRRSFTRIIQFGVIGS